MSFFYLLLAILGLGVLVFIHELGHYIMARRVGMKVEAFAIGFGKPLITWHRDGVEWRLCMLPFGGYVKIAGMQKEGNLEPYEIPDGFFSKRPIDRIKVAIMGPAVNIVFAFIIFAALWVLGGREKIFSEYTHKIGWVNEDSPLYQYGIRPGDELLYYGGRPFTGAQDLMRASVVKDDKTQVSGYRVDYMHHRKTPFDYSIRNYVDTSNPMGCHTIGIDESAKYLIFNQSALPAWSPLIGSGITAGDRLVWADGELLFSISQLRNVISESSAFLTVARGNEIFHAKVPRAKVEDFKMNAMEKAELDDWQHEAGIKGKVQDLFFLPYFLSYENVVEGRIAFMDEGLQSKSFVSCTRCTYFKPLKNGDKILAIDGIPVESSYDLLKNLQKRHTLLIVQNDPAFLNPISWKDEDQQFDREFSSQDIENIIATLGTAHAKTASGNYRLLSPIVPVTYSELPQEQKELFLRNFQAHKSEIDKIDDPDQKMEAEKLMEKQFRALYLGLPLQDRTVNYNPNPFLEFYNVFDETWRTMYSLFSGHVSPKWMSGPVGIVTIIKKSWASGVKEALFWMGMISLNLGFLNLLPIPVLDGGHICFSLFEMLTKKRIKAKTMERLVIPFVALIIGFILYVTYYDISRIFHKFS